jgi:hypothetical protein
VKQARRDLNPQPPDLESGALAVRATGPCDGHTLLDSKLLGLFRRRPSTPCIIVFRDGPYAFDKSDNTSSVQVDPEWCVYSSWSSNSAVDSCCTLM